MTASYQHVNPTGQRVYMGTLVDRADVHEALAEIAKREQITAGTFELLGGLHEVELAAYDFEVQKRLHPLVFQRPLEIIAGHGTISLLDGEPHVHLHLTLSYRDENVETGIQVIGGHVSRAIPFAVEFTLTTYDGAPMHRAKHAGTGLMLWDPAS